ncbi:S-layer homology domain-containing protein [Paenibacillus piri]|uniref:S-layer homology domain-containing protein n=1 Tax=Paenibacillus piri TaxID=2547395 RepID=A0A4R5KLN8_9BACL|nr:S-layer homology domain-containing protein [Paenibacillus piri]TDF95748.1 S-layer homology domain-containing protein [Paenibacillus piri]
MKKSAILIATAAMAFSMVASAAAADTTTVSKSVSDYKDLTNADPALQSKISTLLASGIVEGVSDDTFGIAQNMTRAQFAKVAALIFGLQVDASLQTSSFADVRAEDAANGWAIPYIEAAKKAGLIDGMTDSLFAPGDNVTVGQLDTVFVKGLGRTVSTAASPWYADAVKQAAALGIHPADKSGGDAATRADLVTGAYGSLQAAQGQQDQQPGKDQGQGQQQGKVSLDTVQASGDQAVKVTLDQAIDTARATLTLSKDGTDIPATVLWSDDHKSAVISLAKSRQLTNGIYKVTLGGLNDSEIQSATRNLVIGASATGSGSMNYTIADTYDISNVIDRGLTSSASGKNGFASRAEAEDPTRSLFAKEIEIKAINASGEEVAVPGLIQSITSSVPSIVKTAVSADHRGYILGNKAGTATVDIVYVTPEGTPKQMSVKVNVKDEAVKGELVEIRGRSLVQALSVTNGVYSGQFNAFDMLDMKVTDNYGNEYEQDEVQRYNFALATTFIVNDILGDSSNGTVGTVTIDSDGTVHTTGNVTRFTITAVMPGGKQAAADVRVVKEQ